MRFIITVITATLLLAISAQAQDIRYVSDEQLVPLRSGPGNEYRITHRGLPSGTRLTVNSTSPDGVWSQITTDRGTSGWIRSQYLMQQVPARDQLQAALARTQKAEEKSAALASELKSVQTERTELQAKIAQNIAQADQLAGELAQLKQISGNAVQLDTDNRRLLKETEGLRAELDTIGAENRRLQDKLDSEEFIDGALAVLLGVIITLLVPRLWPKRRKNSGWA